MGLSACAKWISNFVQEIAGVSTDPQGSWSWPNTFSSWVSWSVKQRLVLPKNWAKKCFGHGTVCCTKWILNFVQEIYSLPEFPGLWSKVWSSLKKKIRKNWFGRGMFCLYWMDLEFCARGSWCKNWCTGELVHQAQSLPEFLDCWGRDWSFMKVEKRRRNGKLSSGLPVFASRKWTPF